MVIWLRLQMVSLFTFKTIQFVINIAVLFFTIVKATNKKTKANPAEIKDSKFLHKMNLI